MKNSLSHVMTDDQVVAEVVIMPVPAGNWVEVVTFYTTTLNQEPNPSSPSEAVFKLPDFELHLTNENSLTDDGTKLLNVRTVYQLYLETCDPKNVDELYLKLPKNAQSKEDPHDITIISLTQVPINYRLASASYKYKEPHLTANLLVVGVIHNPNYPG